METHRLVEKWPSGLHAHQSSLASAAEAARLGRARGSPCAHRGLHSRDTAQALTQREFSNGDFCYKHEHGIPRNFIQINFVG